MSALAEKPVRSMTGFAQVRRTIAAGELTFSLRGVNHRGLDLHLHLPAELLIFENGIRAVLKRAIARGHIELRAALVRGEKAGNGHYNRAAVARYLGVFRQAAAEHGLAQEPDLNVALAKSEFWEPMDDPLEEQPESEVLGVLADCLGGFNAEREREGKELAGEILSHTARITHGAGEIARIRSSALPLFQQRLRERLKELLGQMNISESRLAEEAAILVDRSDIQEEVARLEIHTSELRRTVQSGGELGKRIDFLLQEMNRETNTILSKTSGIGETGLTITNRALAVKSHIEKIREQALNIE